MRALLVRAALAGCLLAGAPLVVAQERASGGQASEQETGPSILWAWANFAMLAGALGYLIVKKGRPWFAARSYAIRKEIAEAKEILAEAEARAAQIDRRLAGLEADIEALRQTARREQAAEAERIRRETAADLARIHEHGAREIDAAGKAARVELKRYAARLAVDLAEQKIRRQMTVDLQSALVANFVRGLDRPSAGRQLNK